MFLVNVGTASETGNITARLSLAPYDNGDATMVRYDGDSSVPRRSISTLTATAERMFPSFVPQTARGICNNRKPDSPTSSSDRQAIKSRPPITTATAKPMWLFSVKVSGICSAAVSDLQKFNLDWEQTNRFRQIMMVTAKLILLFSETAFGICYKAPTDLLVYSLARQPTNLFRRLICRNQ